MSEIYNLENSTIEGESTEKEPVSKKPRVEDIASKLVGDGPPPFDTVGLFTYLRTYARRHNDSDPHSTIESWEECIRRVVLACNSQLHVGFTEEESVELFHLLYNLKCSVAGRFLWQLGTQTVDRLGLPSLQNCFTAETKFWTSVGLRSFSDFKDGDKVTVRGRTEWKEATVRCFGYQPIYKLTMKQYRRKHDIYTTKNHRWIVDLGKGKEGVYKTSQLEPRMKLLKTNYAPWAVYVESVEATGEEKEVWCVVEPEYEEFTLENGVLTKNCAFTVVDKLDSFTWTMNMLMLGCGIGFRILPEDVDKLPIVQRIRAIREDTKDADFIVPDSREGWVKLLGRLLKAHFYSGKDFTYSCLLLRSKGAPIKLFGGTASGPDVLAEGIAHINSICNKRIGLKLRPVDVLDIMTSIGKIVISGNVRRCKPENSLVFCKNGLQYIQNVKIGDEVKTSKGYSKVLEVISQGKQNIFHIHTQLGISKCTSDHRMAVLTSPTTFTWKKACELTDQDYLVFNTETIPGTQTTLPEIGEQKNYNGISNQIVKPELDTDIAWFFGYFHGNGSVHHRRYGGEVTVCMPSKYPSIVSKVSSQIARFGTYIKQYTVGECTSIKVYGTNIVNYLGRFKQSWQDIDVPNFILEATPEIRASYLAGLFDADGTFRPSIKQLCVLVTSTSPSYLEQIQSLYASLGIPVKHKFIQKGRKDTHKDSYEIHIVGKYAKDRWKNLVGGFSHKYIPMIYKKHIRYGEDYHYPRSWFSGVERSIRSNYRIKCSYLSIEEYRERYGNYPNLIPIQVLGTEQTKTDVPTYDLSVENNHEYFCAEGLLNHNSALLALGSPHDKEYLRAKRWDLGGVPNNRVYSNNSVVCNDINEILDNQDFWDTYDRAGEPYGLINLRLSRQCGRLGETQYPDPEVDGYNPCFSGDTLIAVADGRHSVSIKQLAEEGKDVPVYSYNKETGNTEIQWGRHPRITGENKELYRVHFSGSHRGQYIDVTANHKFILTDGRTVETKDLEKGDSIPKFTKYKDKYMIVRINPRKRQTEHRLIKAFLEPEKFYQNYEDGVYHGFCQTSGVVVHHIDEDKTNNRPENLEITTFEEHSTHHGRQLVGERNPMHGKKQSDKTKALIGSKTKERCKDSEYLKKLSEAQAPHKEAHSRRMTHQKKSWDKQRSLEHEKLARESGLEPVWVSETLVKIKKQCEHCQSEFIVGWHSRERCYCSRECAQTITNCNPEYIEKRKLGNRKTKDKQGYENFLKQIDIYNQGNFFRAKEFYEACREAKVSYRFQTNTPNPWIAKNWGDFKERALLHNQIMLYKELEENVTQAVWKRECRKAKIPTDLETTWEDFVETAENYNHQVEWVEKLSGQHTVYNITVENNHTVGVITRQTASLKFQGIFPSNCGEQSLTNAESCCLSELYLPNIKSKQELFLCAKYLYRICKHSLTLPCVCSKETENKVHKNMRMGIGVTGYLQCTEEQKRWLPECSRFLRRFDLAYSRQCGFPPSIKLKTVKPSGSLSLLAGCTSGVHPAFAQYYIRRIRIAADSPLVNIAEKHGYPVEYVVQFDGSSDHTTKVISFPYKLPEGTVLAKDCSAIRQLEFAKRLQTDWSDNSVSCTIYYRKEELPEIKEWLRENYNTSTKTVSFLLHSEHGFKQAPLEEITREQYEAMVRSCRPITDLSGVCFNVDDQRLIGEGECAGGMCPIR